MQKAVSCGAHFCGEDMEKKIKILGVGLDCGTVEELSAQAEEWMDGETLHTIGSISMRTLLEAQSDPVLKEVISTLDISLAEEEELLHIAEIQTEENGKTMPRELFFKKILSLAEQKGKTIFVLGERRDKIKTVKEKLLEKYPQLILAGEYALEECVGNDEAVINEINAAAPGVILSILPTPQQEHFFRAHREKLGAGIWCGTGASGIYGRKKNPVSFLKNVFYRIRLRHAMTKYGSEK